MAETLLAGARPAASCAWDADTTWLDRNALSTSRAADQDTAGFGSSVFHRGRKMR
jgi:hypothetical protein